jgi:hypothetical protein
MCKNEFYQDYYQDLPLRTLYNFILYFLEFYFISYAFLKFIRISGFLKEIKKEKKNVAQ